MSAVAPPPTADAHARSASATDLDATLVVEAAAGTGKTTELVARLVALLRSGRGDARPRSSRSPSPRRRPAR